MNTLKFRWRAGWCAIVVLFCVVTTVDAQTNAGIIRGTVKDQNDAAVTNATVTLRNQLTGYTQRAGTNREGVFRFFDVPSNRYTLTVEASGLETATRDVTVASNLLQLVDFNLRVGSINQNVNVNGAENLLDTDKTAPSVIIDRTRILNFPTAQPSHSAEEIIATAPGWTLDANHRLHARGIEYQVQYVIDGMPMTDTVASTFATAPDPRNFRSVEVTTANILAEYGNKLAGVVAVNSRAGFETPPNANFTLSGGSFNTLEGSFDVGGHVRKFGYFISAAGTVTNRFLDPPALENFHNQGRAAKGFFKFDYAPNDKDIFRFSFALDGQRFQVPNLPDQQAAGQDQRRETNGNMQSLTWQHIFSPNTVSNIALYRHYNAARLDSNARATPVFAEQTRHQATYGVNASLTTVFKRNIFKTGFEFMRFPVTESFTFAITDLDALLEKQPDLTEEAQTFTVANPFFFRDRRTGTETSFYVQDHINATPNLTFDLGARFDGYRFLVKRNFVSPRLGAAYHIERTRTVLRASFNRFLETPALENLLLSSSARARLFSPAENGNPSGAPVQLSRETQFDVGFQQQFSRYVRLDADFYYRRLNSPPEITNFLETGIIFPANLARSRSKGVETRLDVARVVGVSGFVSYTNLHIYGFAPITGGLFLGEAVDTLSRAGQRVRIEEDQRNTVAFESRYDFTRQRVFVALYGRHDSGYSVELDPKVTRADFANEFPARILDQVNFERGFVKPRTVLNFSIGKELNFNDHVAMSGQFNVENLTNKFYLITFESVFSGTAIGRPRTYSGKLTFNLK